MSDSGGINLSLGSAITDCRDQHKSRWLARIMTSSQQGKAPEGNFSSMHASVVMTTNKQTLMNSVFSKWGHSCAPRSCMIGQGKELCLGRSDRRYACIESCLSEIWFCSMLLVLSLIFMHWLTNNNSMRSTPVWKYISDPTFHFFHLVQDPLQFCVRFDSFATPFDSISHGYKQSIAANFISIAFVVINIFLFTFGILERCKQTWKCRNVKPTQTQCMRPTRVHFKLSVAIM